MMSRDITENNIMLHVVQRRKNLPNFSPLSPSIFPSLLLTSFFCFTHITRGESIAEHQAQGKNNVRDRVHVYIFYYRLVHPPRKLQQNMQL